MKFDIRYVMKVFVIVMAVQVVELMTVVRKAIYVVAHTLCGSDVVIARKTCKS